MSFLALAKELGGHDLGLVDLADSVIKIVGVVVPLSDGPERHRRPQPGSNEQDVTELAAEPDLD